MHSHNTHTGPDYKKKRVKLTPYKWAKLREQVWNEQNGLCDECNNHVKLHGDTIFNTAHLAHIHGKGAGGGDIRSNVRILCYSCHIDNEHGPQWGKGKTNEM